MRAEVAKRGGAVTAGKRGVETWRVQLEAARRVLGLSRAELARAAGVSASTVRGYEDGRRHPKQESLEAIIGALRLDRTVANPIREAAGFAQVRSLWDKEATYFYGLDELDGHVETVSWPEFVNNDRFEIVAANRAACAVWGLHYKAERARREPHEMSALAVATEFGFPEAIENWDDVLFMLVRGFKDPAIADDITNPSPYVAKTLDHFLRGDPGVLARLLDAWNRVEYVPTRVRWHYDVTWRHEQGRMRFRGVVSTANERDGLAFNDWIPLDAETWLALEHAKACPPQSSNRARPRPPKRGRR